MISNLYLKIELTIIVIITFALSLTVLLNYAKFEHTFSDLAQSRFGFMVRDLQTVTETGLDLGLDLSTMTNVQEIIEREAAKDDQILSIEVFGEDGEILYRTGSTISSDTIPSAWREAVTASDPGVWDAVDPSALVVGTRLTDNFGRVVGGIALRYDRTLHDSVLSGMLESLTRAGVLVLLAAGIFAFISVFLLFHSTNRSLARMRASLSQLMLDDGPVESFTPRRASNMERDFAGAEEKSRETLRDLDSVRNQLHSLSREQ